jgi:hypothetical protein
MLLLFSLSVPLKHAKGLNKTNINLAISTKTKTNKKNLHGWKILVREKRICPGKKRAYGCPNVN